MTIIILTILIIIIVINISMLIYLMNINCNLDNIASNLGQTTDNLHAIARMMQSKFIADEKLKKEIIKIKELLEQKNL